MNRSSRFNMCAPDVKLDLNRELVRNPASTFFARVEGVSMAADGVEDGDLLVIDKSVEPFDGAMVVCFLDDAFTLRRFSVSDMEESDLVVWGVVRHLIKKML